MKKELIKLLNSLKNLIKSGFKFSSLGIVNFILFSILFYYIKSILKVNYIISSAIAYTVVIINASLFNVLWVFREKRNSGTSFLRFFISTAFVYISALIFELLVLRYIVSTFHSNIYITQIIVYMLSGTYCFFMNYLLVFKIKNKKVGKDHQK